MSALLAVRRVLARIVVGAPTAAQTTIWWERRPG